MSKRLGISIPTAFYWRHKLLLSIPKDNSPFKDEVQMDDLWVLYSQKGRKGLKYAKKRGGSHRKGDNNFQVKVLAASDKQDVEMRVAKIGRISKDDIEEAMGQKMVSKPKLVTDKHSSYRAFSKALELEHVSFISKEYQTKNGENVQYVNNLAERFKGLINRTLKGVSTKYLPLYASYFSYMQKKKSKVWNVPHMSDHKVWDIFTNIEKIYKDFIRKKSKRTYRCPTKKRWKSQNWNFHFEQKLSYF